MRASQTDVSGFAAATAAVVALLASGCSTPVAADTPTAAADDTYRAAAEADFPAAGICVSYQEETVRVEIFDWPDGVPQPRCIEVRSDQKLLLINQAPERIEFLLGRFRAALGPGESYAVDLPFGSYLEPGVHSLHVTPHGGPEVFLR